MARETLGLLGRALCRGDWDHTIAGRAKYGKAADGRGVSSELWNMLAAILGNFPNLLARSFGWQVEKKARHAGSLS